jgi:hypothetical protein
VREMPYYVWQSVDGGNPPLLGSYKKRFQGGEHGTSPSERIQKVGNCRRNAGVGGRQMKRGRPNRAYIVQWAHSTGEKIG